MLLVVKSRICFVVTIILLLHCMCMSGQEPVDSMVVAKPVLADSIVIEPAPDTVALPADNGIILLSDTTVLAGTYPLDSLSLYQKHSPAKAAIMSAVLPGLGQVYNKKYWKVPIVYAAIGISVGYFIKWQNLYQQYRRAYIDYKDGDPYTNYWKTMNIPAGNDIESSLTRGKDQLRTWRDWTIVAIVVTYGLNIIDANVDAHLMDFSLDDDISLNIHPCFLNYGANSKKIGLTLQFTF